MSSTEKGSQIHRALKEGKKFLTGLDAYDFLANFDLPLARTAFAREKGELASVCRRIGFPLAIKVVSPQILHKSDVGGVIVNLRNIEEARSGYDQILDNIHRKSPDAVVEGVLVQEMAEPSVEVIVGGVRDPQFGPVVMFGVGGILTEIIKDVSFRIAPISEQDALKMVHEIRSKQILFGSRGTPPADISSITGILVKVSKIMAEYPEISALDLNPVIVYEKGAKLIDVRILIEEAPQTKLAKLNAPLDRVMEPRAIAIIGASSNPDKIGYKILKNCIDGGFKGKIYPINPSGGEILGLRAYRSVLDVEDEVDTVVVVVPAKVVPSVIGECVKKGVKGAVIISSGFRDVGKEGAELEKQVLKIAECGNLRIIGPNCQGVSVPKIGFYGTWPIIKEVGSVGVISQSGSLALEIPSYLSKRGLGYSMAVALGNKSDVNESDLISKMAKDDSTEVVAVYMEGVPDGRALMNTIREASTKKPILVLKGGKTEIGKKAVMAHTGSLAGSNEVFEAAVKQSGGLCVENLEQLFDASVIFAASPRAKGNRVQIITSSGGSGILAVDAIASSNLVLSRLNDDTIQGLRSTLPDWCIIGNPIDLTGNALNDVTLFKRAIEKAIADPNVDAVLTIFGDPIPESCSTILPLVKEAWGKGIPVAINYLGGAEVQEEEIRKFEKNKIPVFPTPERAIKALSFLHAYSALHIDIPERRIVEEHVHN